MEKNQKDSVNFLHKKIEVESQNLQLSTFTQLTARLKKLFMGLVVGFGPKGRPGRVCIKSEVILILTGLETTTHIKPGNVFQHSINQGYLFFVSWCFELGMELNQK